jgi:hypothetical protein
VSWLFLPISRPETLQRPGRFCLYAFENPKPACKKSGYSAGKATWRGSRKPAQSCRQVSLPLNSSPDHTWLEQHERPQSKIRQLPMSRK